MAIAALGLPGIAVSLSFVIQQNHLAGLAGGEALEGGVGLAQGIPVGDEVIVLPGTLTDCSVDP